MKILLFFLLSVFTALEVHAEDDLIRRIEVAQKLKVPLPESTRYDTDLKAREVYLEEYKKAYWLVLAGVTADCHMTIKGFYEDAFRNGWQDGRKAAMKMYPEKAG